MLTIREPACFSLLSQELQDMIWSYSLSPQVITLHYAESTSDSHPCVDADIFFAAPRGLLKSYIPPSPAQLEPIDTRTPTVFSVCRGSRTLAQTRGYKAWTLTRSDGKVRDILWNPSTDTIYFATYEIRHFDTFVKDFPSQVAQIERLSLSYSFWESCYRTETGGDKGWKRRRGSRGMAQFMRNPSSIKELYVIVDRDFYDSHVKDKTEDQLDFWIAPWGIGKGWHSGEYHSRKHFGQDSRALPKISIAWKLEMITHGEATELPKCHVFEWHEFDAEKQEWKEWTKRVGGAASKLDYQHW